MKQEKIKNILVMIFFSLALIPFNICVAEGDLEDVTGDDITLGETVGDGGTEKPAFKNHTELQRVKNLAAAFAVKTNEKLEEAVEEADDETAGEIMAEEAGVTEKRHKHDA